MPKKQSGAVKIIPAQELHRAAWLEMRVALWPECPSGESTLEINRILASEREDAFLAVDESGAALGFAEVSTREFVDGCRSSPVGYLEGIYVRPEYRRQGIGAALVRAAEVWSRDRGCSEMGSDTELDNSASIAFHTAAGFRETDRQVVFLKDINRIEKT